MCATKHRAGDAGGVGGAGRGRVVAITHSERFAPLLSGWYVSLASRTHKLVQAWRTMNCLTVVTVFSLIRKASDQTEGCSGPTRYLLIVTGLCFSQKGEDPVF